MIKFVLALLIFIFFYLLKKIIKSAININNTHNTHKTHKTNGFNKMLACEVCNTYVLDSEAIIRDGKIYCSEKHFK